jgi:ribosomal protein S18 acetylase RimI-like enzyme
MLNLLSKTEFDSTLTFMRDVTETAEAVVSIWDYVERLVAQQTVSMDVLDLMRIEKVYRNRPDTFDHVLLPTAEQTNFVVIVIDLAAEKIKGHYLLDLNAAYSLSTPSGDQQGDKKNTPIRIVETKDHHLISALVEEVQNLHAKLHPELYKPFEQTAIEPALEQHIADPDCFVYLATKEEEAIGYMICFIKEIKENAFHYDLRILYIDQLCVQKAHQKSGAGKLLMEQAEKMAKEHAINRIELDHRSSNMVAAAFFRKKGYEICKERLFKLI